MDTTAQIRPPGTPDGPTQPTDAPRSTGPPDSERPTFGEMLTEIVPLIGLVPVAGPPAVFVLGPWLFLVLMLASPFACLFAIVVVMIVTATVLAALTAAMLAILAVPYRLVRAFGRQRARHASGSAPGEHVVAVRSRRLAA